MRRRRLHNYNNRKGGNYDALQLEAVRRRASRYGLFVAKFVLRMRMNCHFRAPGQNSDTTVYHDSDSDFLKGGNNLATRRRFQLFSFTIQIERVPYFYFWSF